MPALRAPVEPTRPYFQQGTAIEARNGGGTLHRVMRSISRDGRRPMLFVKRCPGLKWSPFAAGSAPRPRRAFVFPPSGNGSRPRQAEIHNASIHGTAGGKRTGVIALKV